LLFVKFLCDGSLPEGVLPQCAEDKNAPAGQFARKESGFELG
jgi:hypothetical protein